MKVKCVDNGDGDLAITIGREYEYMGKGLSGTYLIINDNGEKQAYFERRFEIVKEDNVNKIKIRKWEDLEGLESEDRWGNKTHIRNMIDNVICISTYRSQEIYNSRYIYLDNATGMNGGRERVLEELRLCGFDVEFIEKPMLTEDQKLELTYHHRLNDKKWITRDYNGIFYMFNNKPIKKSRGWDANDSIFSAANTHYDFITWEDDEPWSIEELLKEDN